jgi:hypothetical protein
MLGSTVIDMRMLAELIKRRAATTGGAVAGGTLAARTPSASSRASSAAKDNAAKSETTPGTAAGQLAAASVKLREQMANAVKAGADLPLSLTAWQPDKPGWLDLIRRAVEIYQDNEDQVEAAKDVRELIEEATSSDGLAELAASRLASAARFLQTSGVSPADRLAVRIDELATRLGNTGVRQALAAVDAAGQNLPAAAQALFDSVGDQSGQG